MRKGAHYVCAPNGEASIQVAESGLGSFRPTTICELFKTAAATSPDKAAMRVEREGEWKIWTWADYYRDAQRAARAFISLGIATFDTVNVIGFNSPEW